jgi:hypothetical protein
MVRVKVATIVRAKAGKHYVQLKNIFHDHKLPVVRAHMTPDLTWRLCEGMTAWSFLWTRSSVEFWELIEGNSIRSEASFHIVARAILVSLQPVAVFLASTMSRLGDQVQHFCSASSQFSGDVKGDNCGPALSADLWLDLSVPRVQCIMNGKQTECFWELHDLIDGWRVRRRHATKQTVLYIWITSHPGWGSTFCLWARPAFVTAVRAKADEKIAQWKTISQDDNAQLWRQVWS